jgi:Tol biopolymer transport system component/DNA-binding winged helix-turn-helix (wHTH) protein
MSKDLVSTLFPFIARFSGPKLSPFKELWMKEPRRTEQIVRFGVFEVDLCSGDLRKAGLRIKLQDQPFKVLAALLEQHGKLVTREELRARIWPEESFGDFDHAVHIAIGKLRIALGDSAEAPRFIETVPRRGYRFIGDIDVLPKAKDEAENHGNRRKIAVWIVGVAACALAIGFIYLKFQPITKLEENFNSLVAIPFTTLKGREAMPAFSPDGSQVVFAWDGGNSDQFDLYVKVVGAENISRLTHKPSEWLAPAWSPDGRTIAFARKSIKDSGIFEISAIGGPERKLASALFSYAEHMSLSWSNDGRSLTYADGDVVVKLDRDSGEQRKLTKLAEGVWSPVFSPDSTRIAFLGWNSGLVSVFLMRPDGTDVRELKKDVSLPQLLAWSADGKRVLLANRRTNQLIDVDVENGKESTLAFTQDAAEPAVARRGNRLAYARTHENVNIWGTSLAPGSTEAHRLMVSSTRAQRAPDISPDGKRIAFESDRSGAMEVWVSDIDGGNAVQLTHFNNPETGTPRWSPTGRLIAFDSMAGGWGQYLVDPDGGVPIKAPTGLITWSRDGNWIYFGSGQDEIYKRPTQGGEATLVTKNVGALMDAKESVDGKWLYFAQGDADSEIRVVSSSGGEHRRLAGMPNVKNGTDWALARDGIFFLDLRVQPVTINFFEFSTKEIRQIVTLNKPPTIWGGLSLSPDGKWLAYSQVDDVPGDIMLVEHFK